MTRANRVTVQSTDNGYKATFYRTHAMIAVIESGDTTWQADSTANSTTNRESYRKFVCDHSAEYDIEWNPDKAQQAWDRKYNQYMTDADVAEDTLTLITPAIDRLVDKSRYDMVVVGMEVTAVAPAESNLSYVENGRYTKNGAWCMASIEVTIKATVSGNELEMVYGVDMKSGQICKPKTTIAEWNELVSKELELNGITIEDTKEVKTA